MVYGSDGTHFPKLLNLLCIKCFSTENRMFLVHLEAQIIRSCYQTIAIDDLLTLGTQTNYVIIDKDPCIPQGSQTGL